MGISPMSSSFKDYTPPNPNPLKWELVDWEKCGYYYIIIAYYSGCTTYGGKKLLLCKTLPVVNELLDPHLINDDHIVIARFKPNGEGIHLARASALELTRIKKEEK